MMVFSAELRFHIPDAHSLKEKRQVCRSLVDSVRHKAQLVGVERFE